MSAPQKPAGRAEPDEPVDEQVPPPTPDEDGPHDVPDDKVIEKTLPATSKQPGRGGSGSG
jgi:hypothetical protein